MRKIKGVLLLLLVGVLVGATSRFADTVQLFDQVALMFGGADRTQTGDFYVSYDEATDDRLEVTDGTNTLAHFKDMGTTGDLTVTGVVTGGSFVGPTAAASTFDLLGTANEITCTNCTETLHNNNATLSLPSAVTMPGSLAVTTTLGVTGVATFTNDIAVNGDDITSDGSLDIFATGGEVEIEETNFVITHTTATSSFTQTGGFTGANTTTNGYKASSSPISGTDTFHAGRGTSASPAVVPSSALLRRQRFSGEAYDLTNVYAAYIDVLTDTGVNSVGVVDMPGEIQFSVTADEGTAPTLALTLNSDRSLVGTGSWTTSGDFAVNGDDITSDGDLTITPAGGDTNIAGNVSVTSGSVTTDTYIVSSWHMANPATLWSALYLVGSDGDNQLRTEKSLYVSIDADADGGAGAVFEVEHNGVGGSGTAILTVNDDGSASLNGGTFTAGVNSSTGDTSVGANLTVVGSTNSKIINSTYSSAMPSETLLASDVLPMNASIMVVGAQSGTADVWSSISGGNIGDIVEVSATSGDTITVTESATLIMSAATLTLNGIYDVIAFRKQTSTVWRQLYFSDNN